MVIQRWQSIFLLLASIMMGLFCYLPLASQGNVDFHPYNQPVYLTLNILVAILSFIAIFMFKNLRRQKMVVKVNAFLMVVSAIVGAIILHISMPDMKVLWTAGPLLLICSFMMTVAALRRINHDDKLLKAADRIR